MTLIRGKRTLACMVAIVSYFIIIFYFAVLIREESEVRTTFRLDLFWGYNNPNEDIIIDNILNILSFIPIGLLSGLLFKRYRVLKALLIGLILSLVIELSQLIWKRGTFDVDDLFNNTLGALIGGVILTMAFWLRNSLTQYGFNKEIHE